MRKGVFSSALACVLAALFSIAGGPAGAADSETRDGFYRSLGAVDRGADADARQQGDVLLVSGMIGPGAHRQIQAALMYTRPSLVVLDGPGGVLAEAFLSAEEVRRRGLSTLVAANRSCASACALVFLSGREKYLAAGANVGLHSASYADGRADPEATQLMAEYLSALGVPAATLRRMARTAPSDIRWLTAAEQRAIGIRAYAGR